MDIFFQTSMHPHLPLMTPVSCIAHRGNSIEAPENTFEAFQQAVDLGADFLEVDVHLTKDGVAVITHDLLLSRTAADQSAQATIMDLNVDQIQQLDVGKWFGVQYTGAKIPTLADLITHFSQKIGLMIEIKAGSAASALLAKTVLETIKKHKKPTSAPIYVGSLTPSILEALNAQKSPQPLIAIVEKAEELELHLQWEPQIVAISYEILTLKMVRKFKQMGKKIWVWTVDKPSVMYHLIQMGVDGIISNCPKELLQVLASAKGSKAPRI